MDILSQYEKQDTKPDTSKWQVPLQYGFLIRLVMNMSGGRIREIKKANYILLGMAACIFIITIILLLRLFSVSDMSSADKVFLLPGQIK